jgi:hypothetical protein
LNDADASSLSSTRKINLVIQKPLAANLEKSAVNIDQVIIQRIGDIPFGEELSSHSKGSYEEQRRSAGSMKSVSQMQLTLGLKGSAKKDQNHRAFRGATQRQPRNSSCPVVLSRNGSLSPSKTVAQGMSSKQPSTPVRGPMKLRPYS